MDYLVPIFRFLDARHDKHERIVKFSRDITIESKRAIFLLHRIQGYLFKPIFVPFSFLKYWLFVPNNIILNWKLRFYI